MTCLKVTKNNEPAISVMREALTDVLLALDEAGFKPGDSSDPLTVAVLKAGQALAMPVRNCEVGTPEEQTARLRKLCKKYKPTCQECPCYTNIHKENCWLKWAQMPYEEEEENADESKS